MHVYIHTLGCKVNQYESQAMLERLKAEGYQEAGTQEKADVLVLNSCTVTAASDAGVRKVLRRMRRENPTGVIVLTGCLPQAFPEMAQGFPEADVITGTSGRGAIGEHIQRFLGTRQQIVDIVPHTDEEAFEPMAVQTFEGRTRAFLKIEDGCNRFCAYCIIPTARGRVRSKPLADIRTEVAALAANGYQEIVLTGINLSAYGQGEGLHLCDAVEAACEEPGIARVRLGSLEPERLTGSVIERLSRQEKLCPQFHLSLQSGCDKTLGAMNRHYTGAVYRDIVTQLRGQFPNAAITTDVMVGFPGETREDFEKSREFVGEIGFAKTHVFAYSQRPGTVAAQAPEQVPATEKDWRSKRMLETAAAAQAAFLQTQVGTKQLVLFERPRGEGGYQGHTANYTKVWAPATGFLTNRICKVHITRAELDGCEGELVAPE